MQSQRLLCGDLTDPATLRWYEATLPDRVRLVYSDPPWNPGNATFWRTHAGLGPCASYDAFLRAWCGVVALCIARGCADVLVEQSANVRHADMLRAAIAATPGWTLPERAVYPVRYRGGAKMLPNALLHFGGTPLARDPSGLHGEAMTRIAFEGLAVRPGDAVVDPCMGKGTTSRVAHKLGADVVGSELNPRRLAITTGWLERRGYRAVRPDRWTRE